MLGGGKYPGFLEDARSPHDKTASTQLQLIGHVPTQCAGGLGIKNNVGNEHSPADIRPMKRVREEKPVYMQQNLDMSSNNNLYKGELGLSGQFPNPNTKPSGLRISCDKEEGSSSITSTSKNLKDGHPFVLSLGNTVKMEIDRQMEELAQYIKLQEDNILKGGRELNKRHTISLLNALDKGVNRKLQEKELEIENLNRKNKELEDKIKQVTMEAQSWNYRARHSESVASVLKNNIQQLLAQVPARGHEGFGDSEVDDALSCMKYPGFVGGPGDQELDNPRLRCRSCKDRQVSVLLFPCRHLCLCAECEESTDICPVCDVMKTASFRVKL